MNKRNYGRNLKNFDGNEYREVIVRDSIPITSGLDDQFGIGVKNNTDKTVIVALMSGHYDTSAFVFDETKKTVTKTMSNPAELIAAGYNVDAVADDGVYKSDKGDVTFAPTDPSKTIRSFQDFIKTNPRALKGMRVTVSDKAAFDSVMTVSASSPFSQPAKKDVYLSNFFKSGQVQPDIIDIDFSQQSLELGDITMVFVTVPPNSVMKFNMKF